MKDTAQFYRSDKPLLQFIKSEPAPFFLYDQKKINEKAEAIASAFSFAEYSRFFPVSANPNPTILKILRQHKIGVICETEQELALCQTCGFSGSEILFAPFIPTPKAEALAFSLGATFVIESMLSLPSKPVKSVLLSYRPQGRMIYNGTIYAGYDKTKQGLCREDLLRLAVHLKNYGTESIGLLLHSSAAENKPGYLSALAESLFSLIAPLKEAGVSVSTCFICDALNPSSHDLHTETEALHALYKRLDLSVPIQTECSRCLLMDGGIFVTKILGVAETNRSAVLVTEAATTQLPDFYPLGRMHTVQIVSQKKSAPMQTYDISGCQNAARRNFAEKLPLPTCKAGDYLAFLGAGMNVSGQNPHAGTAEEYLLTEDGTIHRI